MLRLRQFLALASLAAVEALRQPIILLLTGACVLATALTPLLLMYNFGEDGQLVRDSGLAFHFIFGLFVAGYAACSSLSREIRSGTASAVLSKPVDREVFYLAKYAGVAVVVIAFSLAACASTLIAERVAEHIEFGPKRVGYITDWQTGMLLLAAPLVACAAAAAINYALRRPFQSTAYGLLLVCLLAVLLVSGFFSRDGRWAPFDLAVQWRILPVSLLVTLALLLLSAFALGVATRLDTVPTLIFCTVLLLAGLMSDYLFGRHAQTSALARLVYGLVPNWQNFWRSDALDNGGSVSGRYLAGAAAYAAAYAGALLLAGMASFRHAEMK